MLSPYVSTSLRPQGAEIFASPGHLCYLYEIHATPNFIDTFTTLGGSKTTSTGAPYLLHKAEREFLATGGIKWDQVIGYTPLPDGRDTGKKDRKQRLNQDYNKVYDKFKAGGPQYDLADFPDKHEAWANKPWSEFKGVDIKESGLKFADKSGEAVGLKRNTPILFDVKHTTSDKTSGHEPSTDEKSRKEPKSKASSKFRVGSKAGGLVAFQALAPYAHDLLEKIKAWDHPVGHAVLWFDDTMKTIQEAIGGEIVPETGTNELHLKFLCFLKDLMGGPDERHPNSVDDACKRQKQQQEQQGQTEGQREKDRVKGLNQMLDVCEKVETELPADNDLRDSLLKRCQELRDKSSELEDETCAVIEGSKGKSWLNSQRNDKRN
ncbi:hypothetical protein QQS21_009198 [Conoideocrella luteorostrata]|uniref:Uncharacterized protein n=1 Tax=Conoideocrella luteorostrata TaxID=1105319 RepID=A0AAJ0CHD6_9HYPO|nr:hypothetical protein QQS21_009198 [Conoideocrella luteorostrata]